MRARLQAIGVFLVLLLVGAFVGSAISQWGDDRPAPAPAAATREQEPREARVRVEVLNGAGLAGAARTATDRLRALGFDVVFFGNEGSFSRDSSVVLDRSGALDAARAVADALGIHNVRSEPDSNLYLDVSVLLGGDWESLAHNPPAEVSETRTWWNPRTWRR